MFLTFPDLEQKLFSLFSKIFLRGWQNCFLLVHSNSLKKAISWRTCVFSIILGHWTRFYWPIFEKLLEELRKLHSTCPEEQLDENYIFWKKCIFYSLSHFETKIFRSLSEKFRRCRQNSILRFHRNTLKKTIFFPRKMKISNYFRTLSQKVSAFQRNIFGDVVETVFNLSMGTLGRKTNFSILYISLRPWA